MVFLKLCTDALSSASFEFVREDLLVKQKDLQYVQFIHELVDGFLVRHTQHVRFPIKTTLHSPGGTGSDLKGKELNL